MVSDTNQLRAFFSVRSTDISSHARSGIVILPVEHSRKASYEKQPAVACIVVGKGLKKEYDEKLPSAKAWAMGLQSEVVVPILKIRRTV